MTFDEDHYRNIKRLWELDQKAWSKTGITPDEVFERSTLRNKVGSYDLVKMLFEIVEALLSERQKKPMSFEKENVLGI